MSTLRVILILYWKVYGFSAFSLAAAGLAMTSVCSDQLIQSCSTLESEINVRVRLLILKDFPTRTALISDRMLIEYDPKLEIWPLFYNKEYK